MGIERGSAKAMPPTMELIDYTKTGAVQNTWYTAFEGYNVELYTLYLSIANFGEDLQCKITFDNFTTSANGAACNDGQVIGLSGIRMFPGPDPYLIFLASAASYDVHHGASVFVPIKCKHMKIEVRKTSANGASDLSAGGIYGQY